MEDCRGVLLPGIRRNEPLTNCSMVENSSDAAIVRQSLATIIEQCVTIGNVSDSEITCNDTNTNCSIAAILLAEISQVNYTHST